MENTSPELSTETTPVEIAPELLAKLGAIRAIATTHNLLDSASFPVSKLEAVKLSLEFLRSLHEQALADAQSHPQASLVEALNPKKED